MILSRLTGGEEIAKPRPGKHWVRFGRGDFFTKKGAALSWLSSRPVIGIKQVRERRSENSPGRVARPPPCRGAGLYFEVSLG